MTRNHDHLTFNFQEENDRIKRSYEQKLGDLEDKLNEARASVQEDTRNTADCIQVGNQAQVLAAFSWLNVCFTVGSGASTTARQAGAMRK